MESSSCRCSRPLTPPSARVRVSARWASDQVRGRWSVKRQVCARIPCGCLASFVASSPVGCGTSRHATSVSTPGRLGTAAESEVDSHSAVRRGFSPLLAPGIFLSESVRERPAFTYKTPSAPPGGQRGGERPKKKSGTARGCGGWLVRETPRVLCVSSPSVPGPRQASASRIWPYCDVQHGTAAAVAAVFLLLHTSGSARRSACCGNPRPAASAVCLRLLAGASAPLPGLSHPLPGEPVTSGRSSYTCGLPGESRSGAGARTTAGKSWSG